MCKSLHAQSPMLVCVPFLVLILAECTVLAFQKLMLVVLGCVDRY